VTYSTTSLTEWRHLSTCVRQSLMSLWVPQKGDEISWPAEQLSAFKKELWFHTINYISVRIPVDTTVGSSAAECSGETPHVVAHDGTGCSHSAIPTPSTDIPSPLCFLCYRPAETAVQSLPRTRDTAALGVAQKRALPSHMTTVCHLHAPISRPLRLFPLPQKLKWRRP
jgi:hypothetical protein